MCIRDSDLIMGCLSTEELKTMQGIDLSNEDIIDITEYPTCIIYRDDTEYKRYSNSVTWEELRNDINYLTGDEPCLLYTSCI